MKVTIEAENVIARTADRLLEAYNMTYNQNKTLESFDPYEPNTKYPITPSVASKVWVDYTAIKTVDGLRGTIQALNDLGNLGQVSVKASGDTQTVERIEKWLRFMKLPYDKFEPVVIGSGDRVALPHNTTVVIDADPRVGSLGVPLLLRKQPWNQTAESSNITLINTLSDTVPLVRRLSWGFGR